MNTSRALISRRPLLKGSAALTSAGAVLPQVVPRHALGGRGFTPPSVTVHGVAVGFGMMGNHNIRHADQAGTNLVALCEANETRTDKLHIRYRTPN